MKTSTILLIAGAGVVAWFLFRGKKEPGESATGGAATQAAKRLGATLKMKIAPAASAAASSLKTAADISGEATPPGANAANPPCDFSEPAH